MSSAIDAPASAEPARPIPGCESWSAFGSSGVGALVIHGFTGTPAGMRPLAEALAQAGHAVELPRLPGHGTVVEEMMTTRWSDWCAEAHRAYDVLAARVERVVVIGQSMGGALALHLALDHAPPAAVVCVNPITRSRDDETLAMLDELLDDGFVLIPGNGSDIADPDVVDTSYDSTPVAPLLSLLRDGVGRMAERYGELTMPLRLLTSRHDHVVDPADSIHLAASYGGPVEHVWLERSYHVASVDYDRDLVIAHALEVLGTVAGMGVV